MADLPANVFRGDEELFLRLNTKGSLSHTSCHCQRISPSPLPVCTEGYKAENKTGLPFKDVLIDASSVRQIPLRAFKVTGKETRGYLA